MNRNAKFWQGFAMGLIVGGLLVGGMMKWDRVKEKKEISVWSMNDLMMDQEFIDKEQEKILQEIRRHQLKMKEMMKNNIKIDDEEEDFFKQQEKLLKDLENRHNKRTR